MEKSKSSGNLKQPPKSAKNGQMIKIVSVENLLHPDLSKLCSTDETTQVDHTLSAASSCVAFSVQQSLNGSASARVLSLKKESKESIPKLQ